MTSAPTRTRNSRRLAIACGIVAVVGGATALAWTAAPRTMHRIAHSGPTLAIALVAPVEPTPIEGGVMEVGEVTDGFDRAALDRQPEMIEADYLPPDAYVGEPDPAFDYQPLPPGPLMMEAPAPPPEPVRDPLADGSRSFGFDRIGAPPRSEPAPTPVQPAALSEPGRRSDNFFQ